MHVLAPAPFGGAESVVRDLVRGLRGRGFEVGAEVHPIRTPARAYGREARALAELFARQRPEVVHTHGFRPDVQAGRIARRAGIARVTTLHGFTGGGARMRLYEWLQVRSVRRFEAVVVVSRPLEARLRRAGTPNSRLHLVRNAWSRSELPLPRAAARAELGIPADVFALGWVGRLSAEKGADVLIDALPGLGEMPFAACLIGDGPERAALEARAARLGIASRVRSCGVRPQAGRLLGAFDAFVLSSRTEGTPIALLEAMHACVPVVATRVGGVPDVVGEEDAWLVASEDPPALAAALRELRADAAGAARRADAARRRLASAFAPGPWLDAYERIYREARIR